MFRRRSRAGHDTAGRGCAGADPAAQDEQEFADDGEFDDDDLDYAAEDGFEEAGLADEFDDDEELDDLGPGEAGAGRQAEPGDQRGAPRADLGDPATWTRLRDSAAPDSAVEHPAGPWDGNGGYPDAERIDFGSLLVPVREGYDVQVFMSEEEGISIAVVQGESGSSCSRSPRREARGYGARYCRRSPTRSRRQAARAHRKKARSGLNCWPG